MTTAVVPVELRGVPYLLFNKQSLSRLVTAVGKPLSLAPVSPVVGRWRLMSHILGSLKSAIYVGSMVIQEHFAPVPSPTQEG